MSRIRVIPIVDHPVPKPDGTPLSAEGEVVADGRWWKRRERDGDVRIEPVKEAVKSPVKPPAKGKED